MSISSQTFRFKETSGSSPDRLGGAETLVFGKARSYILVSLAPSLVERDKFLKSTVNFHSASGRRGFP